MAAWQRGYKVHGNVANIAKMGANIANIDVSMCQCVDVSMCQCVNVSMCRCVSTLLFAREAKKGAYLR